jgi:hypothetical protein
MAMSLSLMLVALSLVLAAPQSPANCTTCDDCSLGGTCSDGRCLCDKTWSGPACVQLNLVPASKAPLWVGDTDASWGGNAVFDHADKLWHLFFAEFLNDCPLGSWGTNSVVSHATSDLPQGPYKRKETVQSAFHHNPTVAYDASTQTFLLISIGAGNATGTENCTKKKSGQGDCVGLGDPVQAGIITLSHAPTAAGPWTTLEEPILQGRPGKVGIWCPVSCDSCAKKKTKLNVSSLCRRCPLPCSGTHS